MTVRPKHYLSIGTLSLVGVLSIASLASTVSMDGVSFSCAGGGMNNDGSFSFTGCSETLAGGGTTGGSGGAPNDPGMFSGTWIPEGMSNVFVVDQSEMNGYGGTTSIPGCINQKSQLGSNYCGSSVLDVTRGVSRNITMAQGNVISIRYLSESSIPNGQYFTLRSGDGAGIPAAVQISLSTSPADFNVSPQCMKTMIAGGAPILILTAVAGTSYCQVAPNTRYYLNVKTTSSCSGATCRFKVVEPSSFSN